MPENDTPPGPGPQKSLAQVLANAVEPDAQIPKTSPLVTLKRVLALAGFLGIGAGVIHLYSMWVKPPVVPQTALFDGLFNTAFGMLMVLCSRLLAKAKALVIWVFGAAILLSVIYSFAMKRGFNYITFLGGAVIIWQIFNLKKTGEIS